MFRVFALWINMIQNYWTHDRRFGYRRHHDEQDNAMNIGEWLPVTATMSACLQNNHHHSPALLRLSHEEWEYDLGFTVVKAMKALGLVRATGRGATLPKDVPLTRWFSFPRLRGERIEGLAPEACGERFVVQAVVSGQLSAGR